jgi:ketosteroid isomerase-like protein
MQPDIMLFKIPGLFLYLFFLLAAAGTATSGESAINYGVDAGKARASVKADSIVLENKLFTAQWSILQGTVVGSDFIEHSTEKRTRLSRDLFILKFRDGKILPSSRMVPQGDPQVESLRAEPDALKSALRSPGRQVILNLKDPEKQLSVTWKGILRDGSNYLRQEISLHATDDEPITEVELFDFKSPTALVD